MKKKIMIVVLLCLLIVLLLLLCKSCGQPIEGDVKAGDYTGTAEFEVRLELKNG